MAGDECSLAAALALCKLTNDFYVNTYWQQEILKNRFRTDPWQSRGKTVFFFVILEVSYVL